MMRSFLVLSILIIFILNNCSENPIENEAVEKGIELVVNFTSIGTEENLFIELVVNGLGLNDNELSWHSNLGTIVSAGSEPYAVYIAPGNPGIDTISCRVQTRDNNIYEKGIRIEIEPNRSPIIEVILKESDSLNFGETMTLICKSYNPDGDTPIEKGWALIGNGDTTNWFIPWSAPGLLGRGDTLIWQPPNRQGTHLLRYFATDHKDAAYHDFYIYVSRPYILHYEAKALDIGNKFFYKTISGLHLNTEEVTGDTIINDQIYSIIRRKVYHTDKEIYRYLRTDNHRIYEYYMETGEEYCYVDFSWTEGDFDVTAADTVKFLDVFCRRIVRIMSGEDSYYTDTYHSMFGRTEYRFHTDMGHHEGEYLIGAIIRGEIFGETY